MSSKKIDFLAIVSRPDFPTGNGVAGDCFGLRKLVRRRPDLNIAILELNSWPTELFIDDDQIILAQTGKPAIDLSKVSAALYLPICLEVEETNLSPPHPGDAYPSFTAQQWRPVTEFLEHFLSAGGICLNPPHNVRRTNNKLIQFRDLAKSEFRHPPTCVSTGFPNRGKLVDQSSLIAKNVSEGGWKSPTEFSPAHEIMPGEALPSYPVIYQKPLTSSVELRCYVMGDLVSFVQLERHRDIVDVRMIEGGRPPAKLVAGRPDWSAGLVTVVRDLGLDYAVVDAMPSGPDLAVLEVNANGVWWFLPAEVAAQIEQSFHQFLERFIDARRGDRAASAKHRGRRSSCSE
jgi:hypothetical protein